MNAWINLAITLLVALLISPPLLGHGGADSVAAAHELYAAAEYEDALAMLARLDSSGLSGPEARSLAQVRAYCLLALGRSDEAERAIAVIVTADPDYRPSGTDASPRVRAAFSDVRRRLLPGLLQQRYAVAKASFDAREFAAARDQFARLLAALADPDLGDLASQPPLGDLRTLAAGFQDLSATAAVPPPIAARAQPMAVGVATLPARIFGADDAQVTPPVAVRQTLPPFTLTGAPPPPGVLMLVVDEAGRVQEASIRASISPRYDQQLLAAAREWRYTPATLNGRPVKFRKLVQIAVARE